MTIPSVLVATHLTFAQRAHLGHTGMIQPLAGKTCFTPYATRAVQPGPA